MYGADPVLRQRLIDLRTLVETQEYLLQESVRKAVQAGATWSDIGNALAISAEFAKARFSTAAEAPA